jgi:hypothetical protein
MGSGSAGHPYGRNDMRSKLAIGVVVCVTVCGIAAAAVVSTTVSSSAGSVTADTPRGSIKATTLDWTISTNENVVAIISGVDGELLRYVVAPGLSTNLYAITLVDENSIDILAGAGSALSNATVHAWADNGDTALPIALSGSLTLTVTNSALGIANSTNGTLRLYWR